MLQRFPEFANNLNFLKGEDTVEEFSKKLGLTRQTVGFYLAGDRIPDAMRLKEIALACGVSADWLLGLTKSPSLDADFRQVCEYTELSDRALTNLTDNNWWYELRYSDGSPVLTDDGIPLQIPHSGLSPAAVLSNLLEDREFLRILGTVSRNTDDKVRRENADYDSSSAPCEDESDGIRVNPIMRPFHESARETVISICTRHFGNAIERLLEKFDQDHPLTTTEGE